VPLPVDMAQLMCRNWMSCHRWRDMHLPGGSCRLSYLWVPFPPVPLREPERDPRDPATVAVPVAMDSNLWHTWRDNEFEQEGGVPR
jgi:hypothetical protein